MREVRVPDLLSSAVRSVNVGWAVLLANLAYLSVLGWLAINAARAGRADQERLTR